MPPGGNRRDIGSFGPTQLPRRGQLWSKATKRGKSEPAWQPGGGTVDKSRDHRHDNWTAYSSPQQQQHGQGCRFAFGWDAMRAVRVGLAEGWGLQTPSLREGGFFSESCLKTERTW